jgi:hypothetical protein
MLNTLEIAFQLTLQSDPLVNQLARLAASDEVKDSVRKVGHNVFFIAHFDRPVDKPDVNKKLKKH